MEIKHPFTQSISKQKSQKKLKHLETNINKEKFVKLEDTTIIIINYYFGKVFATRLQSIYRVFFKS